MSRIHTPFTALLLSAALWILPGCGRSASDGAPYAETIFWEEDSAWGDYADDGVVEEEAIETIEDYPASDSPSTDSSGAVSADTVRQLSPEPGPLKRRGGNGRIPLRQIGPLREVFNDSNHFQLEHARRLGITPISDLASYYRNSRPLVKVETNPHYRVDELKHSYPYLVPEAAKLLDDIGRTFQDSLYARGGGRYRVIVTSVLRTPNTVRRLRRVNVNATKESTHQYATTFDITYTRFEPLDGHDNTSYEDMKNLLGEVLYDLRRQGRCMVKFERKTPCFHITVAE